jgi:hypothetical protein
MPRSKWSTDSSCDSDGSEKDLFADPPTSDLIVPSPVTLSDAEEDASPSQYRKEMASKECRGQSDDEEGEDDNGEEEKMEEVDAVPEPVRPHRPEMEDMYSDIINIHLNGGRHEKTGVDVPQDRSPVS